MKKYIIWSNRDLNIDDYQDYFEENNLEHLSERDKYTEIVGLNNLYFEDEAMNLDKKIDGRILAIADLGLWNGRRSGYKILDNCLKEILYSNSDYATIYVDRQDVKSTQTHHDGTNYVVFREIREDKNIDKLTNDIYEGKEISRQKLNYYTKSLKGYIKEIYGF